MQEITLAEAIRNLRAELSIAVAERQSDGIQFTVGPIELELNVEISQTLKAEGGVKWVVVNVGVAADQKKASTHKLKVTLNPSLMGKSITVKDDGPAA